MSKRRASETPHSDHGGSHSNYMATRRAKLGDQLAGAPISSLFSGVAVVINGHTDPPSDQLRDLIIAHGACASAVISSAASPLCVCACGVRVIEPRASPDRRHDRRRARAQARHARARRAAAARQAREFHAAPPGSPPEVGRRLHRREPTAGAAALRRARRASRGHFALLRLRAAASAPTVGSQRRRARDATGH